MVCLCLGGMERQDKGTLCPSYSSNKKESIGRAHENSCVYYGKIRGPRVEIVVAPSSHQIMRCRSFRENVHGRAGIKLPNPFRKTVDSCPINITHSQSIPKPGARNESPVSGRQGSLGPGMGDNHKKKVIWNGKLPTKRSPWHGYIPRHTKMYFKTKIPISLRLLFTTI